MQKCGGSSTVQGVNFTTEHEFRMKISLISIYLVVFFSSSFVKASCPESFRESSARVPEDVILKRQPRPSGEIYRLVDSTAKIDIQIFKGMKGISIDTVTVVKRSVGYLDVKNGDRKEVFYHIELGANRFIYNFMGKMLLYLKLENPGDTLHFWTEQSLDQTYVGFGVESSESFETTLSLVPAQSDDRSTDTLTITFPQRIDLLNKSFIAVMGLSDSGKIFKRDSLGLQRMNEEVLSFRANLANYIVEGRSKIYIYRVFSKGEYQYLVLASSEDGVLAFWIELNENLSESEMENLADLNLPRSNYRAKSIKVLTDRNVTKILTVLPAQKAPFEIEWSPLD